MNESNGSTRASLCDHVSDAPLIAVTGGTMCEACYRVATDEIREERPDIAKIRDAYVIGGMRAALDASAELARESIMRSRRWTSAITQLLKQREEMKQRKHDLHSTQPWRRENRYADKFFKGKR